MSTVIKELYEMIIYKKKNSEFTQSRLLKILFQKYNFLDGYFIISSTIQTK